MADQNEVVILGNDGTEHVFPAGFDPQKAAAIVRGQAAVAPSGGIREKVAGALPSVGGAIGGWAGGIPGAALGGAAGEGFRSVLSHATEIPGAVVDVARNVVSQPGATLRGAGQGALEGAADAGISGAVQGAMEGAGKYVVEPLAKGLYATALRPTKMLRDKYGLMNLVNTGFANNIMPTAGGAAKAFKLVNMSKAAQRGMAQAYDAAGHALLPIRDAVAAGVKPLMQKAADAEAAIGSNGSVLDNILEHVQRVYKAHPAGGMSATDMMDAKRAADAIADPAYLAAASGREPVAFGSQPEIAKGFSKGYRSTLNDAVGPKFAAQGQNTKTLYGVARAADRIGGEQHILTNVAAGGVGAGAAATSGAGNAIKSALAFRMLMSPRIQGAAALAAPQAARLGMRAADAFSGAGGEDAARQALIELMTSHQRQQNER